MLTKKHHKPHERLSEVVAENVVEEHILDDKVHEFVNLPSSGDISSSNSEIPILVWVVTLVGLVFGIFLTAKALNASQLLSLNLSSSVVESSTPTQVPPIATSPTPSQTKTRADVRVRVLNGSGTPGLAAIAKTYLESIGYKNIDTGNAANFDNPVTSFSVRPGFPELQTLISSDLKAKYTLSDTVGELPVTGTYDIEVVLGKE